MSNNKIFMKAIISIVCARIPYPLQNVRDGKKAWDSFVILFLILHGILTQFKIFFRIYFQLDKEKKTLVFKTISFKQGKRINERHKETLFHLQVSDSATKDLIQGGMILRLF
jgi:hypothetical protein